MLDGTVKNFLLVFLLALPAPLFAQDPVLQLLKQITDVPSPPGYEEPMRKFMTEKMRPYADSIQYDGLGSVIARQGNSGPRIMIDAHMDELGGMIRHVRTDGFITMQMLGWWLPQALPDQRWTIYTSKGPVTAVTALYDAHIAPHTEEHGTQHQLYLDVGARSEKEAAALGIEPGDPVAPVSDFAELPYGRYMAKAWDDRIGCAMILEAMRRLAKKPHPNQLYYAATIQEEGSDEMRGAQTSARLINPDIGIALEVDTPNDLPGNDPEASLTSLGKGPAIMLYDFSEFPNRKLLALVKTIASDQHIPLQFNFVQGFGDDAGAIKLNGTGVPVTTLLVPTMYTHTHNGIIDRKDFDQAVDLLVAVLEKLDDTTVNKIKSFNPDDDKISVK
jgi:putative aminopeptidase FrvX